MNTPKIDAYFQKLYQSKSSYTPESVALAIRDDPEMLEERLRYGADMLKPTYRKRFKDALFVFSERRLFALDGDHILEYRLRDDLDSPPSLENQQTSMGMIVLYRKIGALSLHR